MLFAAYVYTHLKFAFRLPGYRWWGTVHLTTFRQKFYDEHLDPHVTYARHAISIDERRADFKRVPWGGAAAVADGGDRLEQIWFAGNHADIGGGYPENELRLSDIALQWMVEAASSRLGGEALLLDRTVLQLNPAASGMQHDETRSLLFRLAGKSDRDPKPEAVLHPTIVTRFNLPGVLQYDVVAPYRPEALRGHRNFPGAYDDIPLPRQTCAQRLHAALRVARTGKRSAAEVQDRSFRALEEPTMHRIVSCGALLCFALGAIAGTATLGWRCLSWLETGIWPPAPVDIWFGWLRSIAPGWVGLQSLLAWALALPLWVFCYVSGVVLFWLGGLWSAALYEKAAHSQDKMVTPAQTHA